MITALEDLGIHFLTEFANKVYDVGSFPDDLSKSIFIAIPKKIGTTECELHRTISLLSHVTKIILRVIMLRARNKSEQKSRKKNMVLCKIKELVMLSIY